MAKVDISWIELSTEYNIEGITIENYKERTRTFPVKLRLLLLTRLLSEQALALQASTLEKQLKSIEVINEYYSRVQRDNDPPNN